jgi:hypothetical protein
VTKPAMVFYRRDFKQEVCDGIKERWAEEQMARFWVKRPAGAKARAPISAFSARLNCLVKESNIEAGVADASLRLKPGFDFVDLMAQLKLCPFTHVCPDIVFHQAVKSCPDTNHVQHICV